MSVKKVLLDTDIGNDIDDAFALSYLLRQPSCKLMGVTTVSGQASARAAMASALCCAAGRGDIPIYPGKEQPLLIRQMQAEVHQTPAIAGFPHQEDFKTGQAVSFMQHVIRLHPGEISLLAIGPLTNVALLFSVDPEIPALLKELVLMNGVFTYKLEPYTCLAEWNVRCDPHAAAIVYRSGVPLLRAVGLDVTTRVTMAEKTIRSRLQGNLGRLLGRFLDVRNAPDQPVTFHDPLAATTMFEDAICRFEQGRVRVELDSPALSGLTEWTNDASSSCTVALDVDPKKFFDHYFGVLDS